MKRPALLEGDRRFCGIRIKVAGSKVAGNRLKRGA